MKIELLGCTIRLSDKKTKIISKRILDGAGDQIRHKIKLLLNAKFIAKNLWWKIGLIQE